MNSNKEQAKFSSSLQCTISATVDMRATFKLGNNRPEPINMVFNTDQPRSLQSASNHPQLSLPIITENDENIPSCSRSICPRRLDNDPPTTLTNDSCSNSKRPKLDNDPSTLTNEPLSFSNFQLKPVYLQSLKLKKNNDKHQATQIEISIRNIMEQKLSLVGIENIVSSSGEVQPQFWEWMYNLIMKSILKKYPKLNSKFKELIDTVVFSLVVAREKASDKLDRMKRHLIFNCRDQLEDQDKQKSAFNSSTVSNIFKKSEDSIAADNLKMFVSMIENHRIFCFGNKHLMRIMETNVLPFFSMTQLLRDISAPDDIAFTEVQLVKNFPMPTRAIKTRTVEAIKIKLAKPTIVHLIMVHCRSPWKIDIEDSRKIVNRLKEAINSQWQIDVYIVVNKPKLKYYDVFSILFKNPVTKIKVFKHYNVVLIDHLNLVQAKDDKTLLEIYTSPMVMNNGDTPIVGFNLSSEDSNYPHERLIKLEHQVIDTSGMKKEKS